MGVSHPVSIFVLAIFVVAGLLVMLVLLASVVWQGLSGLRGGQTRSPGAVPGPRSANVPRLCPNMKCRHPNRPGARFCGQCGQRL